MTRANQTTIIAAIEFIAEKKTVCPEDVSEAINAIKMIPVTQRNSISKNSRRKGRKGIPLMPVAEAGE